MHPFGMLTHELANRIDVDGAMLLPKQLIYRIPIILKKHVHIYLLH